VIDFRYHLVSIVAVFLALAIGLVLGATELQGHTIDVLQASSNSLKNSLNSVEAQIKAVQDQENASEQYLQAREPKLLGGLLPGDNVVIVTEPGAQSSVVDGISKAAALAGAAVTGQVALQPKFNDISGATQANLNSINSSIASTAGVVLGAADDPQTQYQQQAAQLVADAILEKSASQPTGLSPTTAQTVLSGYAQAGYLTTTGTPYDGATLAVLVTPATAPSDGANDPANQVLLAVAQEFASFSAATVVAGGTTGSAQGGSAIAVLRSSSVSSEVSSIDNADTTLGQILVVEALASQLAGGKPNSYGISGASAANPLPVASPTTSVTQTPTPHATATGKGKTPVKKK
jgi:Copper transport outer membrane protein, MctB